MPRDCVYQGCTGSGAKYEIDHERFGQSRVVERDLHDPGLADGSLRIDSFGIDSFSVDSFGVDGFDIGDFGAVVF